MRFAPLAFAVWTLAGSAVAAETRLPPTDVAPVTVHPRTLPPKLVSSFPAPGEAVAPGVLVLHITFDQAMLETGFDFAPAPGGETPRCLKTPRLLADGKTFVLLCTTRPRTAYALAFNATPGAGFANEDERRAEPASLAFTTNDDDGPRNIKDALKVANLTGADLPIQDTPGLRRETTP